MAKALQGGCPYYCTQCGDANLPLDLGLCRNDYESCQMYQNIFGQGSALKKNPELGKPALTKSDSKLVSMSDEELERHIEERLEARKNLEDRL